MTDMMNGRLMMMNGNKKAPSTGALRSKILSFTFLSLSP